MRRNAVWLLLLIAAAVAGYVAGARRGEGSGTRARAPASHAAVPAPAEDAAPGSSTGAPASAAADPAPTPEGVHAVRELLTRELRETPDEARIQDAAARAERLRRTHLAAANGAEAEAARQIAEEIRRERAFLEDKARGGTMEFLRNLDKDGAHLMEFVSDEKKFAALFDRRKAGPVVNPPLRPDETLPDGATLSFPPGVHSLRFRLTERFPEDLLVLGSGMDATLVRLEEDLDARTEVRSLTFRDLTIDCNGNYFTDLRSAPAVIRLERCRIVGFDIGAGGSVMIQAPQVAFHAIDCRFESGFGRSPGSGSLFRVQAGVVRFDGCMIQGPFRSICDEKRGTTYLFRRCDIRDAPAGEESNFASPPDGVRFVECTFTYLAADDRGRGTPRPLSDLNPEWPGR